MARMNGSKAAILCASLGFAACEVSDQTESTSIVEILAYNGINPNGINPNGINPNGINPNGINPNGVWTGGITLNRSAVSNVYVEGTMLKGQLPNGTWAEGEAFVGAELQAYFDSTGRIR